MTLGVCSVRGRISAQGRVSDMQFAHLEEKLVGLPRCDGGQRVF